jgi:small subunit ribosomal protein S6
MRKYETMILLSPELGSEERSSIIEALTRIIQNQDGQLIEVDEWGGRELAYPVKNMTRGYYYVINYAAPGAAVAELERNIRITEGIFKFVTVLRETDYQAQEA